MKINIHWWKFDSWPVLAILWLQQEFVSVRNLPFCRLQGLYRGYVRIVTRIFHQGKSPKITLWNLEIRIVFRAIRDKIGLICIEACLADHLDWPENEGDEEMLESYLHHEMNSNFPWCLSSLVRNLIFSDL